MKKSLFGLSAVLLAVIFSAFSTSNMRLDYIFSFTGDPTIESQVEDPARWTYVSTNPDDLNCVDQPKKACRIQVPSSAVNTTPSIALKSTANIVASFFDGPVTDTYYVSGGTSVLDKTNQAQ